MNQQRVSRIELADFCRQFAAMQRANVNIIDILSTLQEQTSNDWFGQILASIKQDVELGRSLASALSRFPADFSPFLIRMVRQGEIEGVLDEVFLSLSQHLERDAEGLPLRPGSSGPQDLGTVMEQLRPLFFRTTAAAGILAVGAAVLWYMSALGTFSQERLGPNMLLLIGAGVLFFALIFLRYKPVRMARCSFCGRSELQAGDMIAGEGVYICESCIATSVRQLRHAHSEPSAPSAPTANSTRRPAGQAKPEPTEEAEENVIEL
jgi:hypothetical protein